MNNDDFDIDAAFAEFCNDTQQTDDSALSAEMRAIGRATNALFRTLLAGPFERDEAWQLVRDWSKSYWEAQHDLLLRDG
jgi:hypothetical protein